MELISADGNFREEIFFDGKNVTQTSGIQWKSAVVHGGKWVLYDELLGVEGTCLVVESNMDIPESFNLKSARGLYYEPGGLLLFADRNFVGTQKVNFRYTYI